MCCRKCKYYNSKRGICMLLPLGYTDGREVMVPSSLVDIYHCKEFINLDDETKRDNSDHRLLEKDIVRGTLNEK